MNVLLLTPGRRHSQLMRSVHRALVLAGHTVDRPTAMSVNSSLIGYELAVVLLEPVDPGSNTRCILMRAIAELPHVLVRGERGFQAPLLCGPSDNLICKVDLHNLTAKHGRQRDVALAALARPARTVLATHSWCASWSDSTWDPSPTADTSAWEPHRTSVSGSAIARDPASPADMRAMGAVVETESCGAWSWRLTAAAHFSSAYFGPLSLVNGIAGPGSAYVEAALSGPPELYSAGGLRDLANRQADEYKRAVMTEEASVERLEAVLRSMRTAPAMVGL